MCNESQECWFEKNFTIANKRVFAEFRIVCHRRRRDGVTLITKFIKQTIDITLGRVLA